VCSNPDHTVIAKLIAEGVKDSVIARRYGITAMSVGRHRRHLRNSVTVVSGSSVSVRAQDAITALEHATWLVGKLRGIAEDTDDANRHDQFLLVADRLERIIKTYGLLTKEITPGGQQLNVFFSEMGVRDGAEIRRALEVVREGREAPLEEVLEDALAAIKLVLTQKPELRQHAMDAVGRFSYAEETNGKAGKAYAEGNHEAHA